MGQRLDLQAILEDILGTDEVYFQPPSGYQMTYPCIVYARDFRQISFADNSPYRHRMRYSVTVMDRDADSLIPEKIAALPLVSHENNFVADQIYHEVFNLYY